MMNNNPLALLLMAAKNGGNVTQMINQMARSNPQMAQASRMISNKSPQQLQQIAINMCRERGISPDEIIKQLGGM